MKKLCCGIACGYERELRLCESGGEHVAQECTASHDTCRGKTSDFRIWCLDGKGENMQ